MVVVIVTVNILRISIAVILDQSYSDSTCFFNGRGDDS